MSKERITLTTVENYKKALHMLDTIKSSVENSLNSSVFGQYHWGDVADSERIVDDLQDLYDRVTNEGEYKEVNDATTGK